MKIINAMIKKITSLRKRRLVDLKTRIQFFFKNSESGNSNKTATALVTPHSSTASLKVKQDQENKGKIPQNKIQNSNNIIDNKLGVVLIYDEHNNYDCLKSIVAKKFVSYILIWLILEIPY